MKKYGVIGAQTGLGSISVDGDILTVDENKILIYRDNKVVAVVPLTCIVYLIDDYS